MKYVLLTLFFTSVISFSQIEKKVCFLGNSYTYVNNLPNVVALLATADGNTLIKDQNTPGGHTLEGHSTNATSLSKISSNSWDFVVLQDQSQRPSFPWEQVNIEVFPYAEILCDSIRSANECAIPLFFNTWGRRDGDDQWDSINTFTKMNQRLHIAYDYMADNNSGMLSPVGIGFEHIKNDGDSPITHTALYAGDGSHPSVYGSYLAACMFYEMIFDVSSVGNTYILGGITADVADYIQDVAHHVLTEVDSITTDYTQPIASYSVTHDGLTASFENTSLHAFTYYWDFGDGSNSTEKNPVHIYADSEEYTVTLTAIYCDRENTFIDGVDHSGIKTEKEILFRIYPNPSINGEITIDYSGEKTELFIYKLDGKLVLKTILDSNTNFLLEQGIYIMKIGNSMQKVIVQ